MTAKHTDVIQVAVIVLPGAMHFFARLQKNNDKPSFRVQHKETERQYLKLSPSIRATIVESDMCAWIDVAVVFLLVVAGHSVS